MKNTNNKFEEWAPMEDQVVKRKSQAVAGILWLVMLHQFYLGKPLIALAQIFTGGGVIVWWVVDGFKIFKGTITDSRGIELD